MSSKAASAVYPHLAKQEQAGKLRDRSESKGEWAKSNDPMWADIPPLPPFDYSKIPGLKRKMNR
jgi:hypothetical protein